MLVGWKNFKHPETGEDIPFDIDKVEDYLTATEAYQIVSKSLYNDSLEHEEKKSWELRRWLGRGNFAAHALHRSVAMNPLSFDSLSCNAQVAVGQVVSIARMDSYKLPNAQTRQLVTCITR